MKILDLFNSQHTSANSYANIGEEHPSLEFARVGRFYGSGFSTRIRPLSTIVLNKLILKKFP